MEDTGDRLQQQKKINESLKRDVEFQKKLNGQLQLTIEQMEQAQKIEVEQKKRDEDNQEKDKVQVIVQTENAMTKQIEHLKNQLKLMEDQLNIKVVEQQSHIVIEQELRNKNDQLLT